MSASDERTVPDAKTEAGLIEDPEHVPTRWYSYVCTASRASDPHRTSGGTVRVCHILKTNPARRHHACPLGM